MEVAAVEARHRVGERGYRLLVAAMFAAGVATFAQLYAVQALLPAVSADLSVPPSASVLTVSLATGGLALSVLPWSALADRVGRVPAMTVSLAVATLLGLATPLAPDLAVLLVLRALEGAALGGLPAVAIAYLAEQVHPTYVGRATGVYIAGTTIGGASGRLVAGVLGGLVGGAAGWRLGLAAVGLLGLAATVAFPLLVRVPHHPGRAGHAAAPLRSRLRAVLTDRGLLALYAQGLLLMGAFVTVYNDLGYRLLAAPFRLPEVVVGLLFVAYFAGTGSSAAAGRLVERCGRLPVLLGSVGLLVVGALLTLPAALPPVAVGLLVLTIGFFAAHATASAWTGERGTAARAQASALYTFAYYLGSSVFGWLGGIAYERTGWAGTIGYVIALAAAAAAAAGWYLRGDPLRR